MSHEKDHAADSGWNGKIGCFAIVLVSSPANPAPIELYAAIASHGFAGAEATATSSLLR